MLWLERVEFYEDSLCHFQGVVGMGNLQAGLLGQSQFNIHWDAEILISEMRLDFASNDLGEYDSLRMMHLKITES